MRADIIRRIIEAYDDPIVRAYCWARFWILRQRFLDEIGHEGADPTFLRRDPRGVGRLDPFEPQQDTGDGDARQERQRRDAPRRQEPARLGEERYGGERSERIEVVLPALGLAEEVDDSVAEAERHDHVPHAEATARERGADRERHAGRDGDPHLPPVERPVVGLAQPRIEG